MANKFGSKVFETVTAYAIDEASQDATHQTLLGSLGLSPDTFCSRLYVTRPRNVEQELENCLFSGSRMTLVYGFPGVGKTSLVMRVLRATQTKHPNRDLLVFRVDFKLLEQVAGPELETDLVRTIKAQLLRQSMEELERKRVSQRGVVLWLLEHGPLPHQIGDKFSLERFDLFCKFVDLNMHGSFVDWVKEGMNQHDPDILSALSRLEKCIGFPEHIYFLAADGDQNRLTVLLFDNIDRLISDETRRTFYTYVRGLQPVIGSHVRVVVVGRTSSLVMEQLSDSGTYVLNTVKVDYKEFIDAGKLERLYREEEERVGFCSELRKLDIQTSLESAAKAVFTKQILAKRLSYLDEQLETGKVAHLVDRQHLSRIQEAFALATDNRHVSACALELSNHDRRQMLIYISNFVTCLIDELEQNPASWSPKRDEQMFVLESYFYHWINDRDGVRGVGAYDLVGDWESWRKSGSDLGCSLTHLILATIYNMTRRVRGKHEYLPRTTIRQVVEWLEEVGYDRSAVIQRLFDLYLSNGQYLGMIETERFHRVRSPVDMAMSDAVWLTPRAAYTCDYLTLKLLFMLSSLRKHRFVWNGKRFDYADNDPVTKLSLDVNLTFLCHLAEMHVKGLAEVRKKLSDGAGDMWLRRFRARSCIRAVDTASEDPCGDLLFNNIMQSHIKFLIRQGRLDNWCFINEQGIADSYRCLLREFKADVKSLLKGTLDLSEVDAAGYYSRAVEG